MNREQLKELLDEEQSSRLRPGRLDISLADQLDDDGDSLTGALL